MKITIKLIKSKLINDLDLNICKFVAYANYDNGKMAKDKHQSKLQKLGVETHHCMNGKDSADINIVCDALEILYQTSYKIDTYVIISCDKDITPLINKIKSYSKNVILITLSINVDWNVLKNYGDEHLWFEDIVGIPFTEPSLRKIVDEQIFIEELTKSITIFGTVNYSLFAQSLEKNYDTDRSTLDSIRDTLIQNGTVELFSYQYNGIDFKDGIRII